MVGGRRGLLLGGEGGMGIDGGGSAMGGCVDLI